MPFSFFALNGVRRFLVPLAGLTVQFAGIVNAQQPKRITLPLANAESEVTFTQVTSVRELDDGSLLVTDRRENRLVHLTWRSGNETVLGRVGNGPGEYRIVGQLYPLSGDSTLFIDSYNGRWNLLVGTRFAHSFSESRPVNRLFNGREAGADRFGNVLAVRAFAHPGRQQLHATADSLVILLANWTSERIDTIARVRGSRSLHQTLPPRGGRPASFIGGNPLRSEDQALLFPDGWIAVARIAPYSVDWRTREGRWLKGSPLPFNAVKVNDREKCRAYARYFGTRRPCEPSILEGWPAIVPPFIPNLREPTLMAAPDGSLVIARLSTATSNRNRYDVVDRNGRLAGVVELAQNEVLIGFGAKSAFVVVTDDLDVQTLKRHPWPLAGSR
jgi:hypothetical protein